MALSGQKTVPLSGTAERLGSQAVNAPLMVKALETNSGVVVIGQDQAGQVTLSSGMRLQCGEWVVFDFVSDLAALWVDAAQAGEGVCWLVLDV